MPLFYQWEFWPKCKHHQKHRGMNKNYLTIKGGSKNAFSCLTWFVVFSVFKKSLKWKRWSKTSKIENKVKCHFFPSVLAVHKFWQKTNLKWTNTKAAVKQKVSTSITLCVSLKGYPLCCYMQTEWLATCCRLDFKPTAFHKTGRVWQTLCLTVKSVCKYIQR